MHNIDIAIGEYTTRTVKSNQEHEEQDKTEKLSYVECIVKKYFDLEMKDLKRSGCSCLMDISSDFLTKNPDVVKYCVVHKSNPFPTNYVLAVVKNKDEIHDLVEIKNNNERLKCRPKLSFCADSGVEVTTKKIKSQIGLGKIELVVSIDEIKTITMEIEPSDGTVRIIDVTTKHLIPNAPQKICEKKRPRIEFDWNLDKRIKY